MSRNSAAQVRAGVLPAPTANSPALEEPRCDTMPGCAFRDISSGRLEALTTFRPPVSRAVQSALLRMKAGLSALLMGLHFVAPANLSAAAQPPKMLPLPGESFEVAGRAAFVILPSTKPATGTIPWVWYAPTLPGLPGTEEKWMFEQFTAAGIAIAGIDVGESYGSPDGCALYSTFYAELTRKRGFAPKAILLGRSRGGLMTLSWAADNADKVAGFAGIYPVCSLASYPGVAKAGGAYHLTTDALAARLTEFNPVDRLAALAKARVPFFAIHGDADNVVPLEVNSGEVKKRYEALGGSMQLIVPPGQGHSMWTGFFKCQELVDFVVTTAKRSNASPQAPAQLQP